MNKLLSKLLLFSIAGSLLISCKKDINPSPGGGDKPIKLVKEIASSTVNFTRYEYNSSNQVTTRISQWQNGGTISRITTLYEYSGNKLIKESNEAGHGVYTYNGNILSKSEHYLPDNRKLSTITYAFGAEGRLTTVIEKIENPGNDNPVETKITYQYNANGNVSRIDFYLRNELTGPFALSSSHVYVEYDNKINPEPATIIASAIPGVTLFKNNPLKLNTLSPTGTVTGTYRSEYTYNADGYPVRRTQYISGSAGDQTQLVSDYKY